MALNIKNITPEEMQLIEAAFSSIDSLENTTNHHDRFLFLIGFFADNFETVDFVKQNKFDISKLQKFQQIIEKANELYSANTQLKKNIEAEKEKNKKLQIKVSELEEKSKTIEFQEVSYNEPSDEYENKFKDENESENNVKDFISEGSLSEPSEKGFFFQKDYKKTVSDCNTKGFAREEEANPREARSLKAKMIISFVIACFFVAFVVWNEFFNTSSNPLKTPENLLINTHKSGYYERPLPDLLKISNELQNNLLEINELKQKISDLKTLKAGER